MAFDIAHTALLAMDCQAGIVSIYIKDGGFIERAAGVVKAARKASMPVVHIQVGFRPGLPEVSRRNKVFAALKDDPLRQKLFLGEGAVIHPALGPESTDIVVTKHRVSAFKGTDLEMVLRAKEVETLVLFGIATSGVVLSTLVEASDSDFNIVVISDCCADQDSELHTALLTRLYPRRAEVMTAEEFVKALNVT